VSRCTPTAKSYDCEIHAIVNGFCIANELPPPEEISSKLARAWVGYAGLFVISMSEQASCKKQKKMGYKREVL